MGSASHSGRAAVLPRSGKGVGAVGGFGIRKPASGMRNCRSGNKDGHQRQLRKFNLTASDAVEPGLREKYAKIYRNY